jgi:hypothetical protein
MTNTLPLQARVMHEGVSEVWAPTHTAEARSKGLRERGERRAAVVGELAALDVAEDRFDGVEVRRIAGQALGREPVPLTGQVGEHGRALVPRQPVPEQDDALPMEVAAQVSEKPDQTVGPVRASARLEEQARTAAIPAEGQRHGHGQPLPVEGMGQDGGLAPGRPGAADDGDLGNAAFILEDEPGALTPGVFFTAGHRRVTHCRIAASSRSRARRAGRWSDQFSRRSRYHTCPG